LIIVSACGGFSPEFSSSVLLFGSQKKALMQDFFHHLTRLFSGDPPRTDEGLLPVSGFNAIIQGIGNPGAGREDPKDPMVIDF